MGHLCLCLSCWTAWACKWMIIYAKKMEFVHRTKQMNWMFDGTASMVTVECPHMRLRKFVFTTNRHWNADLNDAVAIETLWFFWVSCAKSALIFIPLFGGGYCIRSFLLIGILLHFTRLILQCLKWLFVRPLSCSLYLLHCGFSQSHCVGLWNAHLAQSTLAAGFSHLFLADMSYLWLTWRVDVSAV